METTLATRRVQHGARDTELVVNNWPCGGFLGRDALLPMILPEGYSLTVHGPNYPVLEVGLGREKGLISYHAEDGGNTNGTGSPDELVE